MVVVTVPLDWDSAARWVGHISYVSMVFVSLYTMYSGIQFIRVSWNVLGIEDLS